MKLKRNFFCITDNYNKPDFRFLFEDRSDAEKKIKKIKNSTKGETLFLSEHKRDFFIDGIKRETVSPTKKILVRDGCWTSMKVKKMSLLTDIDPKQAFEEVKKSKEAASSFSKNQTLSLTSLSNYDQKANSKNPSFFEFDWQGSFLRTKAFAAGCAAMLMLTFGSVFFINHGATKEINNMLIAAQVDQTKKTIVAQAQALDNKDQIIDKQFDQELDKFVLESLRNFENLKTEEFETELKRMLAGYPIEQMIPQIAKQDRTVAAFLVGIAKKESNWGKRVPVLNGQDCFNYWGYRGIRTRMGTGGHTCFDSPEDAINTVGGRLGRLVKADVDTPQEMVLWKCGSACSSDPMAGKWIRDVTLYFSKVSDGA